MSTTQSSNVVGRSRTQVIRSDFDIYRLPVTKVKSGYSRSTIYLRMSQGLFPKAVRLGPRAVGWVAYEIEAVNRARIAGKPDDEIRALVTWLEAQRRVVSDSDTLAASLVMETE
jgi:prophage regulatory protein